MNRNIVGMIRILILTISCLTIIAPLWAQDKSQYDKLVSAADRYFDEEQYHLAIRLYSDALHFNIPDPTVDFRLAESYRRTFNYIEAEAYYLKVLYTAQSPFPLSLYYYALMRKLNGDPAQALAHFDQFISLHGYDREIIDYVEQAIIEKAGCEIALQELVMGSPVSPVLMPASINSPFNDFAPAFQDSTTLVITSSRVASNRTLIDERYGEAFTDNYLFRKEGKMWSDRTRQEFSTTNSLYNDGSGSFTRKGDQYFFTVCETRCRIYETHLVDNRWTKPALLNTMINHPDAEAKQPSISPGGDTLYFASDRAGGFGNFDIWMSFDMGDNLWSTPVNAGRAINTKANDLAPACTSTPGILFFSSDGHPGYGGYDLYVARRNAGKDTVIYNLNLPFNSVRDDCFITFRDKEIYWSSNREGGAGGFDIYFSRNLSAMGLVARLGLKNRNDSRTVTLTSRTARSENVYLLASRNEETIDYSELTYERKVIVNKMVANNLNNKENRPEDFAGLSAEEFTSLESLSQTRLQTLMLHQKYASRLLTEIPAGRRGEGAASITGRLIDSSTGSAIASARVLLTNEYGEVLKMTTTNEEGQFRFTGVPDHGKLFLRLENGSARSMNTRVSDLRRWVSYKENALYVENVYFDFDHYVIRPEAEQVLRELAMYLKSNPGAQVEIYAFADDRGSAAYNFELTQKRGEAVVSYLTRHGVDETSLAIIPKGKQNIRVAATELQRQYNRRAEFYINGVKTDFTPLVKTYILKKEADWSMLAKVTGIPKSELMDLNGSASNTVKAFQPIRLPLNARSISEELFFVGI